MLMLIISLTTLLFLNEFDAICCYVGRALNKHERYRKVHFILLKKGRYILHISPDIKDAQGENTRDST